MSETKMENVLCQSKVFWIFIKSPFTNSRVLICRANLFLIKQIDKQFGFSLLKVSGKDNLTRDTGFSGAQFDRDTGAKNYLFNTAGFPLARSKGLCCLHK